VLGKALGGGIVPLSAVVADASVLGVLTAGTHGSTFGGNPLACAAAIASLHVILRDKLWEDAARKGARIMSGLEDLRVRYPKVLSRAQGKGLLIGMVFPDNETGYKVSSELFRRGVLVAGTQIAATTVRIEPALTIPDDLIEEVLTRLDQTLAAVA